MPTIHLATPIRASRETCFDLSRSIDLHMTSTAHTGERAIAGRTSGLIGPGESVTWRARHFGVWQNLTSVSDKGTMMYDIFTYMSPLGWLGRLADGLFLKRYIRRLLEHRNEVIRVAAESGRFAA